MRRDLSAVLPLELAIERQCLEPRILHALSEVLIEHERLKQLCHRPDAERARLHRIFIEMQLEEPVAGMNRLLGADAAEAFLPAPWPNPGDALDHQKPLVRE